MQKKRIREAADRWHLEYDYRTFINSAGSAGIMAFFALYNGYLGLAHGSVWHGSVCVYYLFLAVLRAVLILYERRAGAHRRTIYYIVTACLLVTNFCMIGPIYLLVTMRKPVNMTLTAAIIMAAYTTYKIIMAAVNLRKRKQSTNDFVWLLRTIGFIDALMSLLSLQNTLIMVNGGSTDANMLKLSAFTGAVIWAIVTGMSIWAMIRKKKETYETVYR
ncbi:MAG: hypothetical protein IKS37_10925 [Solobacterium sp.]|nr:hypothetical protein [Solobacterium sp.]